MTISFGTDAGVEIGRVQRCARAQELTEKRTFVA